MSELVDRREELNMSKSFPLYPSNRSDMEAHRRDLAIHRIAATVATTNTHEGRTGLGGNDGQHAIRCRTDAFRKRTNARRQKAAFPKESRTLSAKERTLIDAYWRAANYCQLGRTMSRAIASAMISFGSQWHWVIRDYDV